MAEVIVTKSKLTGKVTIPPSKSDVHRAIICGALSGGTTILYPVSMSNDIKATIRCIEAFNAKCTYKDKILCIDAKNIFTVKKVTLDCGESGSTLRFFIPIAAAMGIETTFTGEGLLPKRPIGIYLDALPSAGVECETQGGLPLKIKGKLQDGTFNIPGNVSSQFITGLLYGLSLLEFDSKIVLTSPLESAAYIDMTIDTMKSFGVKIKKTEYGYFIKGHQKYVAQNYTTHGDWSQAAFFLAAGALNGDVTVCGVDAVSSQGDREIASLLRKFGAQTSMKNGCISITKSKLQAIDIDASQIPDLVPILAVVATFAEGVTKIYNAERLRLKESDRLNAISEAINQLGGNVKELPDGLEITGVNKLHGGTVQGCNDHRIVMAMAIASLMATEDVTITDAMSINKSYPEFFEDYNSLGGNANVINMG